MGESFVVAHINSCILTDHLRFFCCNFQQELVELRQERDDLRRQRDRLQCERNAMQVERDALLREKDEMQRELNNRDDIIHHLQDHLVSGDFSVTNKARLFCNRIRDSEQPRFQGFFSLAEKSPGNELAT